MKLKYGSFINEHLADHRLELYLYSIMIYEDFNRPKLFRWMEYIRFFIFKKSLTLGIMQIFSSTYITDKESILMAIELLSGKYQELQEDYSKIQIEMDEPDYHKEYRQSEYLGKLLAAYNIRSDYKYEIETISTSLRRFSNRPKEVLFN